MEVRKVEFEEWRMRECKCQVNTDRPTSLSRAFPTVMYTCETEKMVTTQRLMLVCYFHLYMTLPEHMQAWEKTWQVCSILGSIEGRAGVAIGKM